MFFATSDIKEVEEFWLKYFMMTTNMNDHKEDDLRKKFRDTMGGHFENDSHNKSSSNQLESDDDEFSLQHRIER